MQPFSLFVLLCSLAAALASPLLLLKDCSGGSEVWCQNLQTASNCKAVKHCRQTVWNKPTVKSIPCDLCKDVVSVAGKLLKENTTEEEVHACLYKTCEFLAGQDLVTECKEMVDAYLPNILDMIKEELDNPEIVCSALNLCQSLQKHLATMKLQKQLQSNKIPELDFSELASPFMANVPLLLYPQDKPKPEPQENGDVCKDCVQLVTDIQEAVKSNATFVSSLIHHAEEECDHFFPAFADMCKTYISQYSDMAIQLLMHMQEQQPEDICKMVGFCTSLKSVPLQTLVPAKPKVETPKNSLSPREPSFLCQVCQTMVNEVVGFLERNKTEEEIVSELKEVCSLFPEEYREQCKDFVDIYGKSIIDLLLDETNPNAVCLFLKCCTGKVSLAEKVPLVQAESGGICDVCKMVVAYADKELEKNATTAEIEAFLERVCRLFPASISDQCVQFVDQYEPMVVQLLAEMMDPTFVCNKLGVCVASTQPLLGSEFCVRGPGYWCKNMETASQCNAVEHCKRHVWN